VAQVFVAKLVVPKRASFSAPARAPEAT
jgi:hypothetical protein